MKTKLQVVVLHTNNVHMYYPVQPDQGWKICSTYRCLIIGTGVPRTFIPLDTVLSFSIENY